MSEQNPTPESPGTPGQPSAPQKPIESSPDRPAPGGGKRIARPGDNTASAGMPAAIPSPAGNHSAGPAKGPVTGPSTLGPGPKASDSFGTPPSSSSQPGGSHASNSAPGAHGGQSERPASGAGASLAGSGLTSPFDAKSVAASTPPVNAAPVTAPQVADAAKSNSSDPDAKASEGLAPSTSSRTGATRSGPAGKSRSSKTVANAGGAAGTFGAAKGLASKSQSDGTPKGDNTEMKDSAKAGAKLGSKFGVVGTAAGGAAGGAVGALKTKRGRKKLVLAIALPFIPIMTVGAIIASSFLLSVDSATRPGNDRITSSVETVAAEGIPVGDIDAYYSIASANGIQWQVLPAMKHQRSSGGGGDEDVEAVPELDEDGNEVEESDAEPVAEVIDGDEDAEEEPDDGDKIVGPFGIDMDQAEKLEEAGYPAITREDAEDEMAAAAWIAPIFADNLFKTDPSLDQVDLEAGSEYAEGASGQSTRVESQSSDAGVTSKSLKSGYVKALEKMPVENAKDNAEQVYDMARSWALGNQSCEVNASEGFVNDGAWSNPLKAPLTSPYAMRRHPVTGVVKWHEGSDLSAPSGAVLRAAGSGKVSHAGAGGTEGGWAGNWVEIDHGEGNKTIYAHMSVVKVKEGQAITAGEEIGAVGSTGMSTGPHLHFQVHINGKREHTDPVKFLKSRGVNLGTDKPKSPGSASAPGDSGNDAQPASSPVDADSLTKGDDDEPAAGPSGALPQTFKAKLTTGETVTLKQFQINHAATIAAEGSKMGVSAKGQKIALMTAMQESTMRNLSNLTNQPESAKYEADGDGSDFDSVGLFQQRPGWGSVKDRMTPADSARRFYGGPKGPNKGSPPGLLDTDGWEQKTPGRAAQAVQVSAFPDAYDKWEKFAEELLEVVGGISPMGGTDCAAGEGNETPSDEVTGAPSKEAAKAVNAAKAVLGKPYIWGGNGPDGYDCSGLTKMAYGKAGIDLPRLSYDQDKIGKKISKDALSPGDLIYWKDQWHVAMYLGDGKVIHAPKPGDVVKIVPMNQAHSGTPYGYSRPSA